MGYKEAIPSKPRHIIYLGKMYFNPDLTNPIWIGVLGIQNGERLPDIVSKLAHNRGLNKIDGTHAYADNPETPTHVVEVNLDTNRPKPPYVVHVVEEFY